jgi:hypothetical protein
MMAAAPRWPRCNGAALRIYWFAPARRRRAAAADGDVLRSRRLTALSTRVDSAPERPARRRCGVYGWPLRSCLTRVQVKPLEQFTQNRWRLAQQLITAERIEPREFRKGRVTTRRALEAQPGLLDDLRQYALASTYRFFATANI